MVVLVEHIWTLCYLWCCIPGFQRSPGSHLPSGFSRNPQTRLANLWRMCDRRKGKNAFAGDDSSISCESTKEKKKKKSWICKKRALCLSLGRVVSLSYYFPSQSSFWRSGCQSRNAYKGNRDHLWHSCLHLTLQHHRIFIAVSWPRHSSLNNHLRLSVVTLSSIWHPFTLPLRHHRDTASSIVLNYVIRAHLWLSTENHMEFPCALVNVTSEKGKFRDMTFTILQATVGICCCGPWVHIAQDAMCIFVNRWSVTNLITH